MTATIVQAPLFLAVGQLSLPPRVGVDPGLALVPLVVVAVLIFVAIWFEWRQHFRYQRCKALLSVLEEERAEWRPGCYHARSCTLCLLPFHGSTPSSRVKTSEVVQLACRHSFHEDCLSSAEPGERTCHVCGDRDFLGLQVGSSAVRGPRPLSSMPEIEYQFRLQRMQRFFPEWITESMLKDWCRGGRTFELVVDLESAKARSAPQALHCGSHDDCGLKSDKLLDICSSSVF